MKKILSILLAAILLGSVMTVGFTATAATVSVTGNLENFLAGKTLENLTAQELNLLKALLEGLKLLGIDYTAVLKKYDSQLPVAVKAALHDAGLMSYPIWERSVFFNFIFKYLLLGWLWM
jgi:hypothetical protein